MQLAWYLLLLAWLFTTTKGNPLSSETSLEEENNDEKEEDYDRSCNNQSITLNFANIVLTEIGPNFIASPLISCLRLQSNGINTISPSAFDQLPNLTYLDLSNNGLQHPRMLLTGGHNKLKTLILDNAYSNYYSYNTEPMRIDGSYPALKKLFLRNNNVVQILGSSEADFSRLAYLYLSNNNIRYFGSLKGYDNLYDDFSWLPKSLKHLELDNNNLESLSVTDLPKLEFLSISNNNLETILLQNLNKLKQLITTGNKLKSMSLKNLNGLKQLSAEGNKLTSLSYSQFQGTPELEYLNLSNNSISDFDGRIVDFIPKLENLTLEGNLLTDAPLIRDAPNLKIYSLRCNIIKQIGSNNFNGMQNLQVLYLDNNEITEIHPDTFSDLEKLEILSLGRNRLTNLPSKWMLKMQNLRLLNLEENQFTNLEALELNDSPSLMQLFLQNNPLKYLRAHSLDSVPENVTIELDTSLTAMSDCKYNQQLQDYA